MREVEYVKLSRPLTGLEREAFWLCRLIEISDYKGVWRIGEVGRFIEENGHVFLGPIADRYRAHFSLALAEHCEEVNKVLATAEVFDPFSSDCQQSEFDGESWTHQFAE